MGRCYLAQETLERFGGRLRPGGREALAARPDRARRRALRARAWPASALLRRGRLRDPGGGRDVPGDPAPDRARGLRRPGRARGGLGAAQAPRGRALPAARGLTPTPGDETSQDAVRPPGPPVRRRGRSARAVARGAVAAGAPLGSPSPDEPVPRPPGRRRGGAARLPAGRPRSPARGARPPRAASSRSCSPRRWPRRRRPAGAPRGRAARDRGGARVRGRARRRRDRPAVRALPLRRRPRAPGRRRAAAGRGGLVADGAAGVGR